MKHLLKLLDLSEDEILEILNLADQLKYERRKRDSPPPSGRQDPGNDFSKSVDPHPRLV